MTASEHSLAKHWLEEGSARPSALCTARQCGRRAVVLLGHVAGCCTLLLQKLRRLSRCHELVLKLAQLLGSGDAGCPSALRWVLCSIAGWVMGSSHRHVPSRASESSILWAASLLWKDDLSGESFFSSFFFFSLILFFFILLDFFEFIGIYTSF